MYMYIHIYIIIMIIIISPQQSRMAPNEMDVDLEPQGDDVDGP